MKAFIVIAAILASSAAKADGFVCQTVEGDLNVKVYNQVQPEQGTRNAAVMIVSDPSIRAGNKTIAKFSAANGTLTSRQMMYVADVDLRFTDSSRVGELISGTKLGELTEISLNVDFAYSPASTMAAGEETAAELKLVKRNGAVITRDVVCSRYLKQ